MHALSTPTRPTEDDYEGDGDIALRWSRNAITPLLLPKVTVTFILWFCRFRVVDRRACLCTRVLHFKHVALKATSGFWGGALPLQALSPYSAANSGLSLLDCAAPGPPRSVGPAVLRTSSLTLKSQTSVLGSASCLFDHYGLTRLTTLGTPSLKTLLISSNVLALTILGANAGPSSFTASCASK